MYPSSKHRSRPAISTASHPALSPRATPTKATITSAAPITGNITNTFERVESTAPIEMQSSKIIATVRPPCRDFAVDFDLQLFALSKLLKGRFRAKWGEKKI